MDGILGQVGSWRFVRLSGVTIKIPNYLQFSLKILLIPNMFGKRLVLALVKYHSNHKVVRNVATHY